MKTKWHKRIRLAKGYEAVVRWRKGMGSDIVVSDDYRFAFAFISTPKQARRLADALNHVAELMEERK